MEDFDPLDTNDQDQARAAADALKDLTRLQLDEDFKWLMNDMRGRRLVWRQLASAGVFNSSFNPDAMQMAFNEGRRNSGLELLAQIHALCPDHYTTMMKEQSNAA